MNYSIVGKLIYKDWSLHKKAISLYVALGIASSFLLRVNSEAALVLAQILFFSALIVVSVHLIFSSVVMERKSHTLSFIMSLPLSIKEYTASKILICISFFSVSWFLIVGGACLGVFTSPLIPNGIVPMILIGSLNIFIVFVLCLSVALVSESEALVTTTVTIGNILISPSLYLISGIEGIHEFLDAPEANWTNAFYGVLVLQLFFVLAVILFTFILQSRKNDFL